VKLGQADRIIGFDVELERQGGTWIARCNWEMSVTPVEVQAEDQSDALELLVAQIYRLRSEAVRRRQKYCCAECGAGPVALEIDHVIPRSKGRDDRMSNLVGLDSGCHQRKHGIKVGA
jgi:hypothetical protein